MTIGFIGRFVEQRGIEYLIEAFRQFSSEECRLVLVGDGDLMWDIRRQSEGLNVIFAGETPNPSRWIREFDMAVFPTTKKIGLPIAALEVMAQGVPVIVTETLDARDAWGTRIEVAPKCVSCLRLSMRILGSSVKLRKQIGKRGKKYVKKYHSVKNFQQRMNEIYSLLV
jgi:glycosyltransferase involved in cell wall biosynthesis